MWSKVGTLHFSCINVGLALSGHSIWLKCRSSWSSVSFTECSKIVTSAPSIFGHISANASLYAVIKVSYAVVCPLSRDEIWSSKMTNAVRILAKNVFVFAGLFAAVVDWGCTGLGRSCHCHHYTSVAECATEIKCRICCFDLRTPWYSYQSNRLINRLMWIRLKNRKFWNLEEDTHRGLDPMKFEIGVAKQARKL